MKKVSALLVFVLFLASCQKNATNPITPDHPSSTKGISFLSTDKIPNEIIPLMYKSLKADHLDQQAENLSVSYYNTVSSRTDYTKDALKGLVPASPSSNGIQVTGASLNQRTVPSVGVVLNGNWYSTSGSTSCLLQDIGWTFIDFNAMNGTSPDAFSATLPSSGQFLGTVDQPKRMQAWTLPVLQYGVSDGTTTYFTSNMYFNYASYVQNIAWQSYVPAPLQSGTTDALRIQAIRMFGPSYGTSNTVTFNDASPSTQARVYIYYRVLIQDTGWEGWVSETEIAGTTTQAKRLQAMQIRAYLIKV